MSDYAIKIENVSKVYKLYNEPIDRLKEAMHPFKKKYHKDFYALNNLFFEIKKGETVGIIGKNGSGKSTLLKIITGVLNASSGNVEVNGRISALLELGAGFNFEYTGIQNIYLNGTLMGYTKEEMKKKIPAIIEFADIGDFVNQPVKIYSSGMFVRLAFSVAINTDPEILIVDEALSVGDIKFQQKCLRKIEEFSKEKTVLFVTHDMGVINKFCNRAIWLNEGNIIEDGTTFEVCKKYQAFMIDSRIGKVTNEGDKLEDDVTDLIDNLDNDLDVMGDGKADIIGVGLLDNTLKSKINMVIPGEDINLIIKVRYNETIIDSIIGFTIKDRLGNIITQTNTFVIEEDPGLCIGGQVKIYRFKFPLPYLNEGTYTISPAVASGVQQAHIQHSWIHDAIIFNVINQKNYNLQGIIVLNEIEFYDLK